MRGFKWLFIIGGAFLAILILFSLFSGGYWGMMGGYRGWGGFGCWGAGSPWGGGNYSGFGINWVGWLIGIVFFGLIIAAVIALIRMIIPRSRIQASSAGTDYALDILNNRYAKGEINKEEYEQKRRDLA